MKINYLYIVCEGHTEVGYLKEIKKRERKNNIHIEFCCLNGVQNPAIFISKAYESYVKTVKMFRATKNLNGKVYPDDALWCVYDVDNKSDREILEFEKLAKEKDIRTAQSNPSIELWFLLHFKQVQNYEYYTQHTVETELKKYWFQYRKASLNDNTKYLETLNPLEKKAVQNSKYLKQQHENQASLNTQGPRTNIDDLLIKMKRKN